MSRPASPPLPTRARPWAQVVLHGTAWSTDGQMHCRRMAALSGNSLHWAERYLQVTCRSWSAFCSPGNYRINEIFLSHISPKDTGLFCTPFGCLVPVPQTFLTASFQPFPHPACALWHALQLVHIQFAVSSRTPGGVLGWHPLFLAATPPGWLIHTPEALVCELLSNSSGKKVLHRWKQGWLRAMKSNSGARGHSVLHFSRHSCHTQDS